MVIYFDYMVYYTQKCCEIQLKILCKYFNYIIHVKFRPSGSKRQNPPSLGDFYYIHLFQAVILHLPSNPSLAVNTIFFRSKPYIQPFLNALK